MIEPVGLLAQLPSSTVYIQPFKLLAILLVFTLWAVFAQWVDKDTVAVNTFRTLWNLITMAVGAVGTVVALLVPLFVVGLLVFLVAQIALMVVYIVHRNGLVPEADRVFTATHFRRLREEGFRGKKKVKEVKERVRLTAANRKVVPIPEEDEAREQYRLAQDLFFDALWRRATNVEVVPAGQVAKITYLIDGVPAEREPLTRAEGEAVVLFLKTIAGLNLEERRKPQRGQITAAIGDNKHKVFVRTDGSTAGEKLSLRILYNEESLKAPDLGFNPKQLEQVQAVKEQTHGLVLVSAPSGAGLTTTVYSLTRTHDRFLMNVQTVEYEKELDLDNVTQKIFTPAPGKTFAEELQRLVRADPDVIVLPELREPQAGVIACQAAANKQKVYVGLVALDVFDALQKWLQFVGDKALVARSLAAVSNQRLVRVLCRECKQAYKPDPQMMRKLNLPADKTLYRPPEPTYDKHGNPIVCQACQGTGYVGRTAVFDWLMVDEPLREVIRRSKSIADVQNHILKSGAAGLQAQALQKVLDGTTSIQEVVRAVRGGPAAAGAPPAGAKPAAAPRPKPRPTSGAPGATEGR